MFECPLCEARFAASWAAEECRAICAEEDRQARRTSAHNATRDVASGR